MTDIKLKNGVYSVVNIVTGEVVAAARNRDHARAQLQHAKSKAYAKGKDPKELKLAKMEVQKFIR